MKIPRKLWRILALAAAGVAAAVAIAWIEHSGVLLSDEEMEQRLWQAQNSAPKRASRRAALRYRKWIVDHYPNTERGAQAQYEIALMIDQPRRSDEYRSALQKVYDDFPGTRAAQEAMRWHFVDVWKGDPGEALPVVDDIQARGFDPVLCRLWRTYCLVEKAYGFSPWRRRQPHLELLSKARSELDEAVAEMSRPITGDATVEALVQAVRQLYPAEGRCADGIALLKELLTCSGTAARVQAELRGGMAYLYGHLRGGSGISQQQREQYYRAAEELFRQNIEAGIVTPGISAPLAFNSLVATMLSRAGRDPEKICKVQAFIRAEAQREYLSRTRFDELRLKECAKRLAALKAEPRR